MVWEPLYKVVEFAIVIAVTCIIAWLINKALVSYFRKVSEKLEVDPATYGLIRRIIASTIFIIGVIIGLSLIPELYSLTVGLIAGAGFAGIVIGFAARDSISNIISGIFLAIFHPFRSNDVIEIRGEWGWVEDITLRHTVIRTWQNKRLIYPNSVISTEVITNWSIVDRPVIWSADFGISYDSDIDLARSIVLEEANAHPTVMKNRGISVHVSELGDFAVNLSLFFWVEDKRFAWGTACDIRESVKKRFDKEGIEIPFPYRTIVFKKDFARTYT